MGGVGVPFVPPVPSDPSPSLSPSLHPPPSTSECDWDSEVAPVRTCFFFFPSAGTGRFQSGFYELTNKLQSRQYDAWIELHFSDHHGGVGEGVAELAELADSD